MVTSHTGTAVHARRYMSVSRHVTCNGGWRDRTQTSGGSLVTNHKVKHARCVSVGGVRLQKDVRIFLRRKSILFSTDIYIYIYI